MNGEFAGFEYEKNTVLNMVHHNPKKGNDRKSLLK